MIEHSISKEAPLATGIALEEAVRVTPQKVLNPGAAEPFGGVNRHGAVLTVLAAGKGSRFGQAPKCVQPVQGVPLARHSIDAFRRIAWSPVVCVVGYRHEEVATELGPENVYILSENPTGGTGWAAFEAFSLEALERIDALMVITMGDRIITPSVFARLMEEHGSGASEATLTFLTAVYEPPKHLGKGRVVRDGAGRVLRIVEQRDIDAIDAPLRQGWLELTEGNCPLYAVRASTLRRYLRTLRNDNAQGQYYLTDIVEAISRDGGVIRTITTTVGDPEYDLLCADVTRPMDLALLEGILATGTGRFSLSESDVEDAVQAISDRRPRGQVASIARQLEELLRLISEETLGFEPDQPVGIGISGGRLRIAFMHPDMVRFFGPAWQMPVGAGDAAGEEQIVMLVQEAKDGQIHLFPSNAKFREAVNEIPADSEVMYPATDICDWYSYEGFGTHMSETLLLSLGYFSDEELRRRQELGLPLPPPSLWINSNMRRPFALIGNAIASLRTLHAGVLGATVQAKLGRNSFRGIRIVTSGNIPQGGFSSSSAVTVAAKNSLNALYGLGIPPDLLVHLACQAEYGTGVRAGSLDQATEQKGEAGGGTLISSNPRDNYRLIGTFPIRDRFRILFPYSVARDRESWRWSWGGYAPSQAPGRLTTIEFRKMTGKAAELAAILTRLPLETDFFQSLQEDLIEDGLLSVSNRQWVAELLSRLPLRATQAELRDLLESNRAWHVDEWARFNRVDSATADQKTSHLFDSLLGGWRDPLLRRRNSTGVVVEEEGVPLRAIVAYLFAEVAKNFFLIHHTDEWITSVTRSQWGDCWVEIEADKLPPRADMEREMDWERDCQGPALLDRWLERFEAEPFDFNAGLDDAALVHDSPPQFHLLRGSNFFRGLALIDLAGAMLKRAFGSDAVAVRVNAAGQGDYFQVHVDTEQAGIAEVKRFIRQAVYRRFGLAPHPEFVEVHPGGGAVGVRVGRFCDVPLLIRRLRVQAERPV